MRKSRLKPTVLKDYHITIPASFFSMILGLVGLGSCWRVAANLWHLPTCIGEAIMLLTVAIWLVLLLLYITKWLWARADALAEFEHLVLCCFIGLVPVSTVLVALAIAPYFHAIAVALFVVGAIGQLSFGVCRSGRLWMGGRKPETITPILYLPTVAGGFVSALVARITVKESELPEYPFDTVDGMDHVVALADRLAIYAKCLRKNIDKTNELGDMDTNDLLVEISRAINKRLWFLEANLKTIA